jgi:hypothetical protein
MLIVCFVMPNLPYSVVCNCYVVSSGGINSKKYSVLAFLLIAVLVERKLICSVML